LEAVSTGPVRQRTVEEVETSPAIRGVSMPNWLLLLGLDDLAMAGAATALAVAIRFGQQNTYVHGFPYIALLAIVPPAWIALLAGAGAYDRRTISSGPEEYQRVGSAGLWLVVSFAAAALLFQADISRSMVALIVALVTGLTLTGRFLARKRLHYLLQGDWALHRVVLLGPKHDTLSLARHMKVASYAGFRVVALCPTDTPAPPDTMDLPEFPYGEDLADRVLKAGADTLAVVSTNSLPKGELRRLSWRLEGTGVRLIVAPSLTDFAGPRIVVRPVAGLPLLHIDEPELTGTRRAAKALFDRAAALVLLVLGSPLLIATALAIWAHDRRSPFFTQTRIGLSGNEFSMWKFRSMKPKAELELAQFADQNDHDGIMFKMRSDPRVTPIGRWLRRHSIDELPQLWNVIRGDMSLVGPRPALPQEVERYGDDVRRRLKVKPGMTGLWQISGRADLPWDEAVRLDLHYVENWSVALDLMVLWKTLPAVLQGRGAY
jgi:exopolysaccharide biosynthesis polyprenyl glycosylphosphotransferase